MHRPIVIYLDTQDYIKFFNSDPDSPYQETLNEILKHKRAGNITIGFSWAILLEFITDACNDFAEERIRRGQLISDICGPNAFPFPTELKEGAQFPNGGRWMLPEISADDVIEPIKKAYSRSIGNNPNLNRNQRRKLKRPKSLKEELTKYAANFETSIDADTSAIALTPLIHRRIISGYFAGIYTKETVEEHLNNWLHHPAEFFSIAHRQTKLHERLQDLIGIKPSDLTSLISLNQKAQTTYNDINAKRLKIRNDIQANGVSKQTARNLTKSKIRTPQVDVETIVSAFAQRFGQTRVAHIAHYLRKAQHSHYNYKESDYFDIMHMMYVEDCDLFRCDKHMADLFRDHSPFKGKLVKSFDSLPARIENLLSSPQI